MQTWTWLLGALSKGTGFILFLSRKQVFTFHPKVMIKLGIKEHKTELSECAIMFKNNTDVSRVSVSEVLS